MPHATDFPQPDSGVDLLTHDSKTAFGDWRDE